ncbi:MAG: ester cyclase [Bacteroidales bacterium]|jgi:hypothetical protein|nr:ester cyclase [Bacteroidales bacterium]
MCNRDVYEILAQIYAQAWNSLNANILEDYLTPNFRYETIWKAEILVGKEAFLDYMRNYFQMLQRFKHQAIATVENDPQSDLPFILINYNNGKNVREYAIELLFFYNKICSAKMTFADVMC